MSVLNNINDIDYCKKRLTVLRDYLKNIAIKWEYFEIIGLTNNQAIQILDMDIQVFDSIKGLYISEGFVGLFDREYFDRGFEILRRDLEELESIVPGNAHLIAFFREKYKDYFYPHRNMVLAYLTVYCVRVWE